LDVQQTVSPRGCTGLRRKQPPQPGPWEILVRLTHPGINFMDIHTRQGKYARSQPYSVHLPTTLGIEAAGQVEALGNGRERQGGRRHRRLHMMGPPKPSAREPAGAVWTVVFDPIGQPTLRDSFRERAYRGLA
jgi:hypothetical protein